MNWGNATKDVIASMKKYSPEILTGIGIAGMISAAVWAVAATPKALKKIETKKELEKKETLTKTEVIKTCWTCYIPPVIAAGASAACIIGASSISHKRNAALATAYTISEAALRDYKTKTVEVIGEKKANDIKYAIAKDKIDSDPVTKREVIITGNGNTLCYDAISGRYFRSDIDTIKRIVNDLNRQMMNENYISLNEFYYEIGLANIPLGDNLGWNIERGLIELDFTSQLADDGTPCLVVDYSVAPQYDFR